VNGQSDTASEQEIRIQNGVSIVIIYCSFRIL